ncbi:hypothetical protein ABFV99_13265 [Cytobacillus horneckiae]|uniref:hypothetical protein n=1 Tax=Cytobacillus horneckiae TaxID=549687 RepID=UPI0034CD912C
MFKWFNKKKDIEVLDVCEHEYQFLGKMYSDNPTEFHNGCDIVEAFKLYKCMKCNETYEKTIIEKSFPVYMNYASVRRVEFIHKLKSNGYQNIEDFIIMNS